MDGMKQFFFMFGIFGSSVIKNCLSIEIFGFVEIFNCLVNRRNLSLYNDRSQHDLVTNICINVK